MSDVFVYLTGVRGIRIYRIFFIALVSCGAFIHLNTIWILADIVNGFDGISKSYRIDRFTPYSN